MNMAKNFQELRARMSAEANAASATEHRHLVEEIKLHQLRQARELTDGSASSLLAAGTGSFEGRTHTPSDP